MARTSKTKDTAELEHTAGGKTTRDAMDAGVPMVPGSPAEPVGPEDALGPGPTRGDYSDRLVAGPMMRTVVNPDADVDAGEPRYKLVHVQAPEQGDAPGKGGVSTPEAQAAVAEAAGEPPADEQQ